MAATFPRTAGKSGNHFLCADRSPEVVGALSAPQCACSTLELFLLNIHFLRTPRWHHQEAARSQGALTYSRWNFKRSIFLVDFFAPSFAVRTLLPVTLPLHAASLIQYLSFPLLAVFNLLFHARFTQPPIPLPVHLFNVASFFILWFFDCYISSTLCLLKPQNVASCQKPVTPMRRCGHNLTNKRRRFFGGRKRDKKSETETGKQGGKPGINRDLVLSNRKSGEPKDRQHGYFSVFLC